MHEHHAPQPVLLLLQRVEPRRVPARPRAEFTALRLARAHPPDAAALQAGEPFALDRPTHSGASPTYPSAPQPCARVVPSPAPDPRDSDPAPRTTASRPTRAAPG